MRDFHAGRHSPVMSSRSLPETDGIPASSDVGEVGPSSAWRARESSRTRGGGAGRRTSRVLVAFGALVLLLTTLLRVRHRARRDAARAASREQGAPLRVGGLIYRVLDARRDGDTVHVDLLRSNATQTFFSAQSPRVVLRLADGRTFAAQSISQTECHGGDDCATLDPGESRRDEFVFALPPGPERGAAATRGSPDLEISAGATEPGPRRGEIRLRLR